MSGKKKRNETATARIGRLISCAFQEAALGNEGKARGLWETALKAGYSPLPKNIKGFELAIEKGIRETRR